MNKEIKWKTDTHMTWNAGKELGNMEELLS
jgi:hypothetical protein